TIPSTPSSTLFPYTTLFRSVLRHDRRRPRATAARHRGVRRLPRAGIPYDLRGGVADVQGAVHVHVGHRRRGEVRRVPQDHDVGGDRKSTRLNSSHVAISYAV